MGVTAEGLFINKRIVDAEQALDLGLVHEVVDDADLESRAMAMATDIANGPQVAQRLLKRSVYNAADMIFEQSLDEIAAKTAISDHQSEISPGKARWRLKRSDQHTLTDGLRVMLSGSGDRYCSLLQS